MSLWGPAVNLCGVCCPLQVKTEISVDSKHQTLQGLAFPLRESAKRALQQLAQKRINYIQLVSLKPQHRVRLILQVTHEPVLPRCDLEVGRREGDDRAGPLQPDRNM